jgi:hypothetical protein
MRVGVASLVDAKSELTYPYPDKCMDADAGLPRSSNYIVASSENHGGQRSGICAQQDPDSLKSIPVTGAIQSDIPSFECLPDVKKFLLQRRQALT